MRITSDASSVRVEPQTGRGGHVLVLDSDEGIARTIGAVLEYDGYKVATATTPTEAAGLLHHGHFDVVLADLRTEESDSEDVLARIREQAPGVIVIALARYASFETALWALRAGAYDYLLKPVDVDELRVTVARGLEHWRLERELAARVSELEAAHAEARDFNARLRQQVDDATAELRNKVEELNEANEQLRSTHEEHDRFVAMVAHEMRGPLNLIINYGQLVKRPATAQETINHYSDIVVEQAYRLNRLVDDLQTATRLSTGHFTLRRQACDVAAAVSEVIDGFRTTVHDRRFTLQRPDEPILAEVDPDRVAQAVRNLVDNAVKYSAQNGAVDVSVWRDAERVFIRVQDYGAGIPESQMKRIFEAFTRLEKETDIAGSGLGLFITRGIVGAHGGELTVANGSGSERVRGAIFTIELPLRAPAGS